MDNFKNISNENSILPIFVALLVTEALIISWFRSNPSFWKIMINRWYTEFTWTAVISDVSIGMIGFFITQYIYNKYITSWNPIYFLLILLGVQIVHDILYYLFVIIPYPSGSNKIMDFMKLYANEVSWGAILGDSLMMIMSAVIAMLLKNTNNYNQLFIMTTAIYLLPYALKQNY